MSIKNVIHKLNEDKNLNESKRYKLSKYANLVFFSAKERDNLPRDIDIGTIDYVEGPLFVLTGELNVISRMETYLQRKYDIVSTSANSHSEGYNISFIFKNKSPKPNDLKRELADIDFANLDNNLSGLGENLNENRDLNEDLRNIVYQIRQDEIQRGMVILIDADEYETYDKLLVHVKDVYDDGAISGVELPDNEFAEIAIASSSDIYLIDL